MKAKASVERELYQFMEESQDIIENFEGFEELQERRLTDLLRNDLTEGLEGYLRWMKKRADNFPLENETDKTMYVCFLKEEKEYNIYPISRKGPFLGIVLLYDEFEWIVNNAIEGVRNGRADRLLRWDAQKLVYEFADAYIKQKEGGTELKNV